MGDVEILIVGSPARKSPAARTAGSLQKRMLRMGATVRRVTSLDEDVQVVADEITAVLRRAPKLLVLVGAVDEASPLGLADASQRSCTDAVPEGAFTLGPDRSGIVMLVGATQVVIVPESPEEFDELWADELGDAIAEWFGQPTHTVGELVILDATPAALNTLIAAVGREHPAVNLKVSAVPAAQSSVRVTALACGRGSRARRTVDAALAEVERAASAARLQVSSTGRVAAHGIGPDA